MTTAGIEFSELRLRELLDGLERPEEASAGGTAAALAAASAASVVTLVARGSPEWEEAGGVVAQARRLRSRLVPLARADADAFGAALAALAEPEGSSKEQRDAALGRVLDLAAELPLAIAEAAADVAELASLAAAQGEPAARADAVVAAALAEGAVAAAVELVERNLATQAGDERSRRAAGALEAAARARALAANVQ